MGHLRELGSLQGTRLVMAFIMSSWRCFKCNGIIPTLSLARFVVVVAVVLFVSLLARALFFALSALKSESMYSL